MIKRFLLIISLLCLFVVAAPPPPAAAAYDVFNGVDCSKAGAKAGDTTAAAVCVEKGSGDPISGNDGALLKITNIVAFIAGIAAIIMIIVGGIKYVVSDGDSGKISSAKSTLMGALIGLIIVVLARTLINYVVTRL